MTLKKSVTKPMHIICILPTTKHPTLNAQNPTLNTKTFNLLQPLACSYRNFGGANAPNEGKIHLFSCFDGWLQQVEKIDYFKGGLLRRTSFFYLDIRCFLIVITRKIQKTIFSKSIISKVFYRRLHHFFISTYDVSWSW